MNPGAGEQFAISFEQRLQGGNQQGLAEPSRPRQEHVLIGRPHQVSDAAGLVHVQHSLTTHFPEISGGERQCGTEAGSGHSVFAEETRLPRGARKTIDTVIILYYWKSDAEPTPILGQSLPRPRCWDDALSQDDYGCRVFGECISLHWMPRCLSRTDG